VPENEGSKEAEVRQGQQAERQDMTHAPRLGVALLCVLAGALALASAPASAEKIYYPGVSFGEPGSGPGQLKEPVGIAVNDETGDVYVADTGNKRVEEFTEQGVFITEFAPPGGFEDPEQVAVDNSGNPLDPSAGDVYVTDTGHDHNVIDKFSATGKYEGQLTGACEKPKETPPCATSKLLPFESLRGVAVDATGNLWIYGGVEPDEEGFHVLEFSDTGAFEGEFSTERFSRSNHAITVGSGGSGDEVSVGVGPLENVLKVTVAGTEINELEGLEGHTEDAIALASIPFTSSQLANDVLVDKGSNIALYTPITENHQQPLEAFPTEEDLSKSFTGLSGSEGLAVNSSATVFASERGAGRVQSFDYVPVPKVVTEPPSGVSETGLTLHGIVDPEDEKVKECYFEYGTEAGVYTKTAECDPKAAELGEGTNEIPVRTVLSGLEPASVRGFRLVAVSGAGVARRGSGLTVSRPVASGAAVANAGSVAVNADAEIDPGSLASCYWVEYGPSTSYGQRAPREGCISAGDGDRDVSVSVELTGLQPASQDHFRFVASNALGMSQGADVAFTTFPASSGLPDGRVYEAVSPVGTADTREVHVPETEPYDDLYEHGLDTDLPLEAAPGGDAVTYVADPPAEGGSGNFGSGGGDQYLARRLAGGGWAQAVLNAPGYGNDYVGFSSDLSVGILSSLEDLGGEHVPVGYANLFSHPTGGGAFEPLVTAMAPCGSGQFGTAELGILAKPKLEFMGGNSGSGAVAPFSHLLFEANGALPSMPAAPATTSNGSEGCGVENDLYDSVGGRLYLVNVLPGGEAQAGAIAGHEGYSGPLRRKQSPDMRVISADGSRVYWSAVETVERVERSNGSHVVEERPRALYVRENDTQPEGEGGECEPGRACTVQVDLPEPGAKGPKGGGSYWTASTDGSRVFFTDENLLTKSSSATVGAPDLYEYDLEAPEEERLTDLSVPVRMGTHADVQGVVGASEDGSYVYFVADGVLTVGGNVEGVEPVEGQPNLYLRHGGRTLFIATLAPADEDLTQGTSTVYKGDWQPYPGFRTAEVTPDGQSVVFVSHRSLTGYDNLLDGVPLTEVYVYDAGTGRLACASCNPSGEAPTGDLYAQALSQILASGTPSFGFASLLPTSGQNSAGYQLRVVSEDGSRVFFDSVEPLVPQDTNGFLDVYEWEAPGEGSCTSATASAVTGGCTFLLSGGQGQENSYLVDASADGSDVFFVSRSDLVKADRGDFDVLYDARVGGVEPPEGARCSGAGCQGVPPAPPVFATPASVTFDGIGNFPSSQPAAKTVTKKAAKCKKPKKRSHGKCLRKKLSTRAKRAGRERRRRR
jgi:hypothetical protein